MRNESIWAATLAATAALVFVTIWACATEPRTPEPGAPDFYTESTETTTGWYKTAEGKWQYVEDGIEVDLQAEQVCALLIQTTDDGSICIEPEGTVVISGETSDTYREFWEGVAREYPTFIEEMCEERWKEHSIDLPARIPRGAHITEFFTGGGP